MLVLRQMHSTADHEACVNTTLFGAGARCFVRLPPDMEVPDARN